MPSRRFPLSQKANRTGESPISYFMQQAIENPDIISLAAGLVDEDSLPASDIAAAVAGLLADPNQARAALQYGTTQGYAPLRERIVDRFCQIENCKPSDLHLSLDDVVITNGSQQLLYLLGEVLFDPGDIVITEAPSYFVYHALLNSKGVRVRSVPMDDQGMDTGALEELLAQLEHAGELHRVKLIYTVDYFQNPSGRTLSRERRAELLDIVRRFSKTQRILILEDAAYRELRFDGPDLPSVKRFDTENEFVVYASTFSKPLAPGLKTGYALLPRELMGPILHLKSNHDFGTANLSQHIAHRLLETGAYHRHVEKLRETYRPKRDAMLDTLSQEFADWPEVCWTKPMGGMFVWLSFPRFIDTGSRGPLIQACVREGVLYVPGEFAQVDETREIPRHEIRLAYGVGQIAELQEGIRRLRRAARVCQAMHEKRMAHV